MATDEDTYDALGDDSRDWDRLEKVVEIRRYEGGVAYLADLDGKPCFALNEAALEGDDNMDGRIFTPIYAFETVEARDAWSARWVKPFLRSDLMSALVAQYRSGELSRDDLRDALQEIERADSLPGDPS
jgi:hypothetical protein